MATWPRAWSGGSCSVDTMWVTWRRSSSATGSASGAGSTSGARVANRRSPRSEIRFLAECAAPVTQALRRAQLRSFADRSSVGRAAGRRRPRAVGRARRAGPDASDDGVPPPPGAPGRRPVAGPGRSVQRRRPATRRRGGRRRPPAVVPRPPPRRPMGHAARRPDRRGEGRRSGHRGHHRADRPRRPARGLRAAAGLSPRESELVGLVVAGLDSTEIAARMFALAAHGPGPPQVGLREDATRSRRDLVAIVRGG